MLFALTLERPTNAPGLETLKAGQLDSIFSLVRPQPLRDTRLRKSHMPKSHIITVEELNAWLGEERWETFASTGNKKIEFSTAGRFRVTDHSKVTYKGDDREKAVDAYNIAP